jgi:hypothetical protein
METWLVWVSYDNLWLFYAGSIVLILLLYVVKAVCLQNVRTNAGSLTLFAAVIACCVPVTWALSPDWHNPSVFRIAIYVGSPVATLAVPTVSFIIDIRRRSAGHSENWLRRMPLEWFIAVPAWFFLWIFLEFFVLGWVWI